MCSDDGTYRLVFPDKFKFVIAVDDDLHLGDLDYVIR